MKHEPAARCWRCKWTSTTTILIRGYRVCTDTVACNRRRGSSKPMPVPGSMYQ